MAHILALKIEDVVENAERILVSDISIYDGTPSTVVLSVKALTDSVFTTLSFTANSKNNAYTSVALAASDNAEVMPDGLYEFTYEVDSDDSSKLTIYHFRIITVLNSLYALMSKSFVCSTDAYYKYLQTYLILRCVTYEAEKGNYQRAGEFYNKARLQVQAFNNV